LSNLNDMRERARTLLPKMIFDYIEGGAHDEWTLRENERSWRQIALLPRVLTGVSAVRLECKLIRDDVSAPIAIAPTAFQSLCHPDGEVAVARAASQQQVLMVISSLSTRPLEEIRRHNDGALWLQLYLFRDRGVFRELIARAESLKLSALVLTVDAPPWGIRERDVRNGFKVPKHLQLPNLPLPSVPDAVALPQLMDQVMNPIVTWEDIEWIRQHSSLPLVLKGVIHHEDAILARKIGVDGLVVSNHGGRQLDGVAATATVLARIVNAVEGSLPVFVDGGIRRGTDVLKALALGATAVFVGRPILWGLSIEGECGVASVLKTLRGELDLAMRQAGTGRLQDIGATLVRAGVAI
jgi:isopentenyl diphosphate isomerase/L-lactate dehydrogenase-like FMN-dependent dehydrogenase